MISYLFLVSIFILLASPIFFIGYILETKQENAKQELRDQIAKQSRH